MLCYKVHRRRFLLARTAHPSSPGKRAVKQLCVCGCVGWGRIFKLGGGVDHRQSSSQAVFRSVILARFLYASPAWWGFAGAQDRQKVYSFLRRSARVGFYCPDSSSFDDLCIQADQSLFNKVLHNPDHVLHRLLPPVAHTSHNYSLRPRAHDRSLPERLTHLTDCNFIIRMLFYQVY